MSDVDKFMQGLVSARAPICDDCLTAMVGWGQRQTANAIGRRLGAGGSVSREIGVCHTCGNTKAVSAMTGAPQMAESRPAGTAAAFVPEPLPPQRTPAVAGDGRSWYWEGTVQSTLVGHLASEGYRIKQVANTATKAAGVDIVAERSGRELWVTVKGYPVATSKTNAPVQARHWFSGAIFDAVLYRGERRDVDIVVGLPDGFATYQKLALRIGWLKEEMPFRFAWVSEAGKVREE